MNAQPMTDRFQVLAFRASGHHLGVRLPAAELSNAVGAIGIRDVRGSAVVSLHARVEGVTQSDLDRAMDEKTILDVISARGTDTLVPAEDVAVFTVGTLPAGDESLRARLKPFLPVLDRSGYTATDALERAKDVARGVLAAGPLDIGALSGALTRALPALSPMCRGRCGVAHIEQGLFDLVGESGIWRHERVDGVRLYVPMDEPIAHEDARTELLRRYLRCYGPSTAAQFAQWCGISVKDATRSLSGAETTAVARGTYVLTEDLPRLESPPEATGVRILPPRDPYLLDRDRVTLIPDRDAQKRVWRATPTDGVILVAGVPVASWRPAKAGKHLLLNVQAFARLTKQVVTDIEREAAVIALHRNCISSKVALSRGTSG